MERKSMATKKESANTTEDLLELRELVESTYEEMQLSLQSSSDPKQSNPQKQSALKTSLAAFNLAMGAALQKVSKIAEDPSILGIASINEGEIDSVTALGKLTWYLLRIAPFLGNPKQNILVAQLTGAVIERLNFDERLRSKEHCGLFFQNFRNFIIFRKKCIEKGETTDQINTILQSFCPPLMVYFCKDLELFHQLRNEAMEDAVKSLEQWSRPITMIRQFMLQAIDETILLVFVERAEGESTERQLKFTFAQRVKVSGLYVNRDLTQWAASKNSGMNKFFEAGDMIEMSNWTGLRDDEEGILCGKIEERPIKVHRIYQEGIPNDVTTFKNEKIILFYNGKIKRKMGKNKVFPMVETKITKEGEELTASELIDLQQKIESASSEDIGIALDHQIGRGSNDEMIHHAKIRLKMSSLLMTNVST